MVLVLAGLGWVLAPAPGWGQAHGQPHNLEFHSARVPLTPFATARGVVAEPPDRLAGRLYWPGPVPGGKVPALVVLPGCLGEFPGDIEPRLAARFRGRGFAVLVVESLLPRLLNDQCLWNDGAADRVADAIGALTLLAGMDGIDAGRIAVLGFGPAGTSALSAVAADGFPESLSPHRFAAAIAYYPRCETRQGMLAAPALIVVGGKDATAPAHWCRDLPRRARAAGPGAPEYLELPGAGHGFDLAGATDPAGQGWGEPAPVYDPGADAAADAAVAEFLRRVLDLR